MPAVRKVSKEQIIDAAVDVLRDDGFSAINARSVAKKLGCSTQPIYFSFKNMDELKAAVLAELISSRQTQLLAQIKAILDHPNAEDDACFYTIESIVDAFSRQGIYTSRHDFS